METLVGANWWRLRHDKLLNTLVQSAIYLCLERLMSFEVLDPQELSSLWVAAAHELIIYANWKISSEMTSVKHVTWPFSPLRTGKTSFEVILSDITSEMLLGVLIKNVYITCYIPEGAIIWTYKFWRSYLIRYYYQNELWTPIRTCCLFFKDWSLGCLELIGWQIFDCR